MREESEALLVDALIGWGLEGTVGGWLRLVEGLCQRAFEGRVCCGLGLLG